MSEVKSSSSQRVSTGSEIPSNFNVLTINDIMERFGVCRGTASDIVNSRGFPKIELGNIIRIREASFERWLKAYDGRHVITDEGKKIHIPSQNGRIYKVAAGENKKLLTAKELTAGLHVCEKTARRLIAMDGFPKTYSGKRVHIPTDDLDKWLVEHEGKHVAIS